MLNKVSEFIVRKRYFILAVMLVIAIACIFMMRLVEINEDMTKYLPDDSSMKAGMDVMTKEFPEMEASQTIRVMFDGLTTDQKDEVLDKLEVIPYVDSVTYEADSEDYNKDNHTLFVLNTNYAYNSEEELSIETALDENFTEYSVIWHNDDTSSSSIPTWLIASALIILLVILFAMCGSWIEPILFIAVIGIAIVINMGTNILMNSVSDVTFSIAAILQLVLSMDYSIILINRYRQEKEKYTDNKTAMKEVLAHAFSSIASSSLTTVVGLLMLIFMSFKIGMDLGIVLAKGVFISMVCVLTMMPSIILACDRLIQKTSKKALHIPMGWASKFSYRFRHALGIVFVVIFAGVYLLQTQTGIAYTLEKEDKVAEVFAPTNTLVMVYENKDEAAVRELAVKLEKDEKVKSVMSYFTMLGKPYHFSELANKMAGMGSMALDESVIKMLYYDYFMDSSTEITMTAVDFMNFISGNIANNETFSDYIGADLLENIDMIQKFSDANALTTPMNEKELGAFLGMDESRIADMFLYYYMQNGGADTGSMTLSVKDFIDFINSDILSNSDFAELFDKETAHMLSIFKSMIDAVLSGKEYTAAELSEMFAGVSDELNSDTMKLMYLYAAAEEADLSEQTMTIEILFDYLVNDVLNDARFTALIDSEMRDELYKAKDELETGKRQFVGERYSRMIINAGYAEESPETTEFLSNLMQESSEKLSGNVYFIGNSAMTYEMQQIFDSELLLITLLTALAIFLIIALTFKSLFIPLILVLIVQCGVYATISVIGLQGGSIYYLALLIVECILMGATIDYGILFTNYYCESRKTLSVKEALRAAYIGSTHTILTSGLILILVTAIVGNFFSEPTVAAIVRTLSIGALCAIVLILFVLPGILALCDGFVVRKKKR